MSRNLQSNIGGSKMNPNHHSGYVSSWDSDSTPSAMTNSDPSDAMGRASTNTRSDSSTASASRLTSSSASWSTNSPIPVLKSRLCRRCGERGHLAKNCRLNHVSGSYFQADTASTVSSDDAISTSASTQHFCASPHSGQDLVDLKADTDDDVGVEEPEPAENIPYIKHTPRIAKQWSDLDPDDIRKKVEAERAFSMPLADKTLIDEELTHEAARVAANATVPVQLTRKRKGRKGRTWYDLSPFVNT
ncbi:uncharacterized protein HMPREF1541_00065 [Cyphellophora europaea CBS 101466]|uniref:CCHC-type domain-containing protein n=1 Tax=Cyphellophora europaea (strain CBS 101466) TaxID=1220924 RepID=W2SDC7_CYPE1|nr:uncharacterized protein HMPREF1541_00065 [Cyphellophora europaea CBS 101466]ETN45884.1 hypothetical protein HMPREF1541_00065 [Cyphellophora europaea CBS 101466]